jgi:hypothetical protein
MSMLGFFRKRQKLIFVIMVLLMVSFLVGFQGLSMIFGRGDEDMAMAETKAGPLTYREVQQAESDIDLLRMFIGGFGRSLEEGAYTSLTMQAMDDGSVPITYALLLKQAQAAKLRVSEAEVDRMVARLRENPQFDYDAVAVFLRQNRSVTEQRIREVLGRWALILKDYQASALATPPSQSELKHLYRDISEKLKLKIVKVAPEMFMDQVGEPTEEQLAELFEEYKGRQAGDFQGIETFSFGYTEPAKVSLAWLYLSRSAVMRGAMPSQSEIMTWIDTNQDQLVKNVPANASDAETDADTDGENGEAVKPQVLETVPLTVAEQRAKAIEALRPQAGEAKFAELSSKISRDLLSWQAPEDAQDVSPAQAYFDVAADWQLPAEDLLNRNILVLYFNEPTELDSVIDTVAAQAEPPLTAICYPWGTHENVTIDRNVKIPAIQKRNLTVGEALAEIGASLEDMPELTWGMCKDFEDVLFPTDGLRVFPVTAGQVGLSTRAELNDIPRLANARTRGARRGGLTLLDTAFDARPINPGGTLAAGDDAPPMMTWTEDGSGMIFWRLLGAVGPKVPETMTEDVRQQLTRDWKLREAFKLAKAKAAEITSPEALQAFIEENNLEPIETRMLSRKSMGGGMMGGMFMPTPIRAMGFTDMAIDMYFLSEAFSAVAPQDPNAEYPQVGTKVASIALPSEGYVTLVQRVDYRPALGEGYQQRKAWLMNYLEMTAGMTILRQWFNPEDVKARVNYTIAQ